MNEILDVGCGVVTFHFSEMFRFFKLIRRRCDRMSSIEESLRPICFLWLTSVVARNLLKNIGKWRQWSIRADGLLCPICIDWIALIAKRVQFLLLGARYSYAEILHCKWLNVFHSDARHRRHAYNKVTLPGNGYRVSCAVWRKNINNNFPSQCVPMIQRHKIPTIQFFSISHILHFHFRLFGILSFIAAIRSQ